MRVLQPGVFDSTGWLSTRVRRLGLPQLAAITLPAPALSFSVLVHNTELGQGGPPPPHVGCRQMGEAMLTAAVPDGSLMWPTPDPELISRPDSHPAETLQKAQIKLKCKQKNMIQILIEMPPTLPICSPAVCVHAAFHSSLPCIFMC